MAHKNNEQNLIPFNERSEKEKREIQEKGRQANKEKWEQKKGMQNIAKWFLEMPLKLEGETPENIQSFAELAGKKITVEQAILIKQMQRALKGDLQSAMFIRDTSGQKPVEVQQVIETPVINDDI